MENFAVDLDKVLDDFEFDEDNTGVAPSTVQADINTQALPKHGQDFSAVKSRPDGTYPTDTAQISNRHRKNVYNSRYGIPYDSNDKFDMSGADFGPSPPRTTFLTTQTLSDGYNGASIQTNLRSSAGNDSGYGSQQFGFECNNGSVGSQVWDTNSVSTAYCRQAVIPEPAITQGYSNGKPADVQNADSFEVASSKFSSVSDGRQNATVGVSSVNSVQQDSYGLPVTSGYFQVDTGVQNQTGSQFQANVPVATDKTGGEDLPERVIDGNDGFMNSQTAAVPEPHSAADLPPEAVQVEDPYSLKATQPGTAPITSTELDVSATGTFVGQIKVLQCCGNESPVHSGSEEIVIAEPSTIGRDQSILKSEPSMKLDRSNDCRDSTSVSLDSFHKRDDSSVASNILGDNTCERTKGELGGGVDGLEGASCPFVTEQVSAVAGVDMHVHSADHTEKSDMTEDDSTGTIQVENGEVNVEEGELGDKTDVSTKGPSSVAVEQTAAEMHPSLPAVDSTEASLQADSVAVDTSAFVGKPSGKVDQPCAAEPEVVGFGDVGVDDVVDDAEMDHYLNDVESSMSDDKPSSGMNSVSAPSDKTNLKEAEQDSNLDYSPHDKRDILPSPVVTNFQTQFSSENNEEPSVIPPSEILPFLTESPKELVSTPADDPGLSRIPGYSESAPVVATPTATNVADVTDNRNTQTMALNPNAGLSRTPGTGIGARPKESTQVRASRPNSLIGLSKPSLPTVPAAGASSDVSLDVSISDTSANALLGLDAVQTAMSAMEQPITNSHDVRNQQISDQTKRVINKKQLNVEIKHQMDQERISPVSPSGSDSGQNNLNLQTNNASGKLHTNNFDGPMQASGAESLSSPGSFSGPHVRPARPNSFPAASAPSPQARQKRPTSLNLPPRTDFSHDEMGEASKGQPAEAGSASPSRVDDVMGVTTTTLPPNVGISSSPVQEGATASSAPAIHVAEPTYPNPQNAPASIVSQLGKVAPIWVPDSEAPNCMQCDCKFTFTRRRHHCRACGKVFCSTCCNLKSKLPYMDNKEARVCQLCHVSLIKGPSRSPNPNNPSEYCSVISPMQQANPHAPPPTVMVPVGVLKREGTQRRGEPKSVMFSDGIRPGGDLTELDGSSEPRPLMRKTGRTAKKVERAPATPVGPPDGAAEGAAKSSTSTSTTITTTTTSPPKMKQVRLPEANRNVCLIPEAGLPPVILQTGVKGDYTIEEDPDPEQLLPKLKNDDSSPVVFAVNKNLFVLVKILNLDCCVNRICWCFTTKGMCTVGQDEIVIVLDYQPDEKTVPRDIFSHLNTVYEEAGKGNTVSDLGHTIFGQSFLGSKDHGGFLYIRPTFQCLQKLILPEPPYVFGILLQKWETPWAKVFPIRLMLRLGAEYRYYPCPLISVRFRNSAFVEIGHTIMNLLADFRSYQYMLPQIKGVTIHMEDKITYINFPKNRYDEVMKVISNSNDHVMALGASFSSEADSHLVCIQNDEGNYQTQAINIQNKPRKVTGASFVVFNGALKSSSGLTAKSSIVEDGLMVQIAPESMVALKQALRDMKDYRIGCGSVEAPQPEEVVMVQWTEDDKNVNIGVKSPIDGLAMDGVKSIRISNATDYVGETRTVRWTEVFFIQEDSGTSQCDPVDLSRLAETLNQACCVALIPHLDKLKEANLTKIGLRITVDAEKVGYEIGANGEKLPSSYMNDLDNELIPVIHNAASNSHDSPISLELILHILE